MKFSDPTTFPFRATGERDVAVLMSGGVDSSTAAMMLRDEGWNVVGITMLLPLAGSADARRPCCGLEAAYVCRSLGIAHYFVDVREEFNRLVIEPFRSWYCSGRTPSPCVDCNTDLKFGLVWDAVRETLGVQTLATGHYARIERENGHAYLARAADRSRDQSYFLYGVRREMLPHLLLPLGDLTKAAVRRSAKAAGLAVSRRSDSMELCFAESRDYRAALGGQGLAPGPILNERGEVIGTHSGIANYTIGQRKGIGIPARKPLFVSAIDPASNAITVADRESLFRKRVSAIEPNVLIPELFRPGVRLRGRVRSSGSEPSSCTVEVAEAGRIEVVFDDPVFAPTPGQRLVLYDARDRVTAGGIICP